MNMRSPCGAPFGGTTLPRCPTALILGALLVTVVLGGRIGRAEVFHSSISVSLGRGSAEETDVAVEVFRIHASAGFLVAESECHPVATVTRFSCSDLIPGAYLVIWTRQVHDLRTTGSRSQVGVLPESGFIDLQSGDDRRLVLPELTTSSALISVKGLPKPSSRIEVTLHRDSVLVPTAIIPLSTSSETHFDLATPGDYEITEIWAEGGERREAKSYISVNGARAITVVPKAVTVVSFSLEVREDKSSSVSAINLSSLAMQFNGLKTSKNSYRFEGVPTGTYQVSIPRPSPLVVEDLKIGPLSTTNSWLAVEEGLSEAKIFVDLKRYVDAVSGTALPCDSGAPAKTLTIANASFAALTPVNADGKFELADLRPGEYYLNGWSDDPGDVPFHDWSDIKMFKEYGIRIDVEPGTHLSNLEVACATFKVFN